MTIPQEQSPSSDSGWDRDQLETLIDELVAIRREMLESEKRYQKLEPRLFETHRDSARNLLHYLALRRHDIRQLQSRLASLGLSSLGRSESHVLDSLNAVLKILHHLVGRPWQSGDTRYPVLRYEQGRRLLERHTQLLLGPEPPQRRVRIMVTMPSEAADDTNLMRELLANGMDCIRTNCAHDSPEVWQRMIDNLRRAEQETGRCCRVLADLPGPKLRTGPLAETPQPIRWRPRPDRVNRGMIPARVWLYPIGGDPSPPMAGDAALPVPEEWLDSLLVGDRIEMVDALGTPVSLDVVEEASGGKWAISYQRAQIDSGTPLTVRRDQETGESVLPDARTGEVPTAAKPILLFEGDTLILTREQVPGSNAVYDAEGRLLAPAHIGCTLPEVFTDARPGERIWLDDGKIGGVILSVTPEEVAVRITHARIKGEKLRAEKGINLPDSRLRTPSLTEYDREILPFIAQNADLVGLSFVQSGEDVDALEDRLIELGGTRLGIVLKIETQRAFERLPELMLSAMRTDCAGVMIARGDLAVECGYERLAEVQEEILWICEAAHMPVIWATQVLESLAQSGMPSRAEITDAAMAVRAECVMLNKGPHIVDAVRTLDDILRRMQTHQQKKVSLLRQLRAWEQNL